MNRTNAAELCAKTTGPADPQIHQELTVQTEQLLEQGADPSEVREVAPLAGARTTAGWKTLDLGTRPMATRMMNSSRVATTNLSYQGLARRPAAAIEENCWRPFQTITNRSGRQLLDMEADSPNHDKSPIGLRALDRLTWQNCCRHLCQTRRRDHPFRQSSNGNSRDSRGPTRYSLEQRNSENVLRAPMFKGALCVVI